MKQGMLEYFTAYRVMDEKIVARTKMIFLYVLIWGITIIGYNIVIGKEEFTQSYIKDLVMICALFIPFLFTYVDIVIHPVVLDKQRYLAPMTRKERKNLIYNTYYFRIGFDMLIHVLGVLVLVPIVDVKPLSVVLILLNDFILCNRVSAKRKMLMQESCLVIFALLINIFQLVVFSDVEYHLALQIGSVVVFVLLILPLAFNVRKLVKEELESAIEFEGGIEG